MWWNYIKNIFFLLILKMHETHCDNFMFRTCFIKNWSKYLCLMSLNVSLFSFLRIWSCSWLFNRFKHDQKLILILIGVIGMSADCCAFSKGKSLGIDVWFRILKGSLWITVDYWRSKLLCLIWMHILVFHADMYAYNNFNN